MTGCPDDDRLVEYVEQVLSSADAQELEEHVDGCPACRHLLARFAIGTPVSGADTTLDAASESARPLGALADRYEIRAVLGTGGMSIVYAARDRALGRNVALKIIRPNSAELGGRIAREARALAQLSHPNVLPIYDVGVLDGRPFLVTELVVGQTLAAWMTAAPRTPRDIARVFVQAASGLAAAHAVGIAHRDFKPSNVLIGADDRVRVADFGLARAATDGELAATGAFAEVAPAHTRTGALVGTPAYMAPEQLAGETADARSDQYAFAASLFEAVHGRRPVIGASRAVQGSQRGLPAPLARVLARGLAVDPAARYPTMQEIVRELERVLDPPRVPRRLVVIGGAVLAAAAAIVVVVLARGSTSERTPAANIPGRVAAQVGESRADTAIGPTTSPTDRDGNIASRGGDDGAPSSGNAETSTTTGRTDRDGNIASTGADRRAPSTGNVERTSTPGRTDGDGNIASTDADRHAPSSSNAEKTSTTARTDRDDNIASQSGRRVPSSSDAKTTSTTGPAARDGDLRSPADRDGNIASRGGDRRAPSSGSGDRRARSSGDAKSTSTTGRTDRDGNIASRSGDPGAPSTGSAEKTSTRGAPTERGGGASDGGERRAASSGDAKIRSTTGRTDRDGNIASRSGDRRAPPTGGGDRARSSTSDDPATRAGSSTTASRPLKGPALPAAALPALVAVVRPLGYRGIHIDGDQAANVADVRARLARVPADDRAEAVTLQLALGAAHRKHGDCGAAITALEAARREALAVYKREGELGRRHAHPWRASARRAAMLRGYCHIEQGALADAVRALEGAHGFGENHLADAVETQIVLGMVWVHQGSYYDGFSKCARFEKKAPAALRASWHAWVEAVRAYLR